MRGHGADPDPGGAARWRLHRINVTSQLAALAPIGLLLVIVDSGTWWEAAVLIVGVAAGLLASARWAVDGVARVAFPCLAVTAAVWVFGVLVSGSFTAFYGFSIVAPIIAPQLPRHRVLAAVGLTAFVGLVGLARPLVDPDAGPGVLIQYVLIPTGVVAVATGLMFVNQKFYALITELEESREREAELAVFRERARFAGDLHDIQGHTLHVVKLKAALAEKLVRTDPVRAEEELREIHALVGDTITRTKELAYAQRRLNLAAELENAKNLFEAAGIRVRVDRAAETDTRAGELLGQVLRETTTNILRHAEAGEVRITLSESGITIENDGAREGEPPELRGLATLRQRLADSGGELRVERRDGRFVTAATLPAVPVAAGARGGGPMTSVVLADDEALLRKALASLLPLEGDVTVLAEAEDGAEAVRATLRHRPDVLVIDLEMPGVDGLGAVAEIRRELPDQVILMLTRHARPGVLRKALRLGVQGFVSKSAEPSHITSVIQTLHAGKRWIDPDVSALAVVDDCPLTDRELDALRVTGEGYSVAEIAAQLHLAEGTVRNYLSSAMRKTGTRTRHEAARYARRHDWL